MSLYPVPEVNGFYGHVDYKSWHPIDHIEFKWTKGKPMESGSSWYGKEIVRGKVFETDKTCIQLIYL